MKPRRWFRKSAKASSSIELTFDSSIVTVPELGWSRVPIIFKSVLFPEPDGPTTATDSPSLIENEIPFRTETEPSPRGNDLFTSDNSTTDFTDDMLSLKPKARAEAKKYSLF